MAWAAAAAAAAAAEQGEAELGSARLGAEDGGLAVVGAAARRPGSESGRVVFLGLVR